MISLEVTHHILDRVSIGLFDEIRGRKGHCDHSIVDVGEVELAALKSSGFLGAGNYLADKVKHSNIRAIKT